MRTAVEPIRIFFIVVDVLPLVANGLRTGAVWDLEIKFVGKTNIILKLLLLTFKNTQIAPVRC